MTTEHSPLINSRPHDPIVIDPKQCSIKGKVCYGKVAPSIKRHNCAQCLHFCCNECSITDFSESLKNGGLWSKITTAVHSPKRICHYCLLTTKGKFDYAKNEKIPE